MPFSFNPFTGQLDYTDPNIVSGVAASLAYLSDDVDDLAANTANLESDQQVLTANLGNLQAQYNSILIDPIIKNLQSNTANNLANTTILFSSIAAANVEIANNTSHIGDLYANTANQQAEIQSLTVSVNTLQYNVANNLANIVNNYAYAGNNAAEILLLQANAVNLTANVVQAEFDIANNAANISLIQTNTDILFANTIAQEIKIAGLTTDAANLRINVVNVEFDTSNNANAIAGLKANTANLLISLVNTINVSVSSSNAISDLTSNVVSLESMSAIYLTNIADLWAANTATNLRITNSATTVQTLQNLVLTLQGTVGGASSGLVQQVNQLDTDVTTLSADLGNIPVSINNYGGIGDVLNDLGIAKNNATNAGLDIQDLKLGKPFTLTGPWANNTEASNNGVPSKGLYFDSNNIVRYVP